MVLKIDYSAICFNNNLRPFLYMRVATLSRTTLPKPWTVLALATLALVLAGTTSLDTDRSELIDENQKFYVTIDAQTGNVDENTAQGQVAHSTTVTGTPTACTIGAGNDDQDGDGNKPFSIATSCVISVNDAGDLDYEGTGFDTSYTLRVHVNDATSSDWAFVTLNVNDVDEFDVTTPTDSDNTANTVAEDIANGQTVGITASATDADGTTNTVTYAVQAQSCGGALQISDSSTGVVTVANTNAIDYEAGTTCTITVRATSADNSHADETFTLTLSLIHI